MLAAVLQKAGYRTGLFTSPHLVDFRERIRVDGEMIPEEAVVEFTERYKDEMVHLGLTFFEMATAMGLWWFERAGCDVAVIETGLGGRLDSTNIIAPAVSVITNIGLEHTQYLGDTIAAIAAEKAGIIKAGVPVVIGETDPESAPVFRARAAELGSEIVFADDKGSGQCCRATRSAFHTAARKLKSVRAVLTLRSFFGNTATSANVHDNYNLDLGGEYQKKNLATVLAAVDILRRTMPIPDRALREGLAHAAALTGLAGRWQVVGRAPLVVLDTAHNAHGIAGVARQIERQKFDKLYMVLGFAGDKELSAIVPLLPPGAHYILTQAATPRAMPAEELAARFVQNGIASEKTETATTVPAAVRRAIELAAQGDGVFIGGSNFVVGEALQTAEIKNNIKP
jgi:dihydrofolate synthase/folylpolyglutamate synthase